MKPQIPSNTLKISAKCPFKVGQRIKHVYSSDVARVTSINKNGFAWKTEKSSFSGVVEGETYNNAFDYWEVI